jgi:hypothetical protein
MGSNRVFIVVGRSFIYILLKARVQELALEELPSFNVPQFEKKF